MKKLMTAALAVTLLAWGQGLAAQTTHTESVTKRKGPGPDDKVKTETVTGKVTEYEAGKEIEVEGPGGEDYEFDLDEQVVVKGAIAPAVAATKPNSKKVKG